jgi:hypothetical protein
MKGRHWSIIAILALLNYLVFSQLIVLFVESNKPAPTPTRTPKPTFTPTFTASPIPPTPPPPPTFTPTATLVVPPTDTPTPEGGPTSTPPPEATATPAPDEAIPTATPRPPTATPQPAPPTAVPPTATAVPPTATSVPTTPPESQYQYGLGRSVTCSPNCGTTGVKGVVYDVNANYVPGLIVKVWADGWCCGQDETSSYAPYEIMLSPGAKGGHWYVAVYSHDESTQLSDVVDVYTDWEPCAPDSGGCQWPVVDFVAQW